MAKCGICGMEVKTHPKITETGKCDLCGKKLVLEEQARKEKLEERS